MKEAFKSIKNLRVLVIGDVMLDKYIYTEVNRISPEAPIPIARYKKEKSMPGGAANVALNIRALGARCILIGKIGEDKSGEELSNLLLEKEINFIPIITDSPTITKTRIISGSSQLLRLDREDNPVHSHIEDLRIIGKIEEIINDVDFIIVSDYAKGTVGNNLISYLKSCNRYVSMDTKQTNHTFEGIDLITPNFREAKILGIKHGLGDQYDNCDKDVEILGTLLRDKLHTNILLTRSEKGVSYIGENGIYHDKSLAEEVVDVSGAGDTCISIFSILDFLEVDKKTSLHAMNCAAKVAVSKIGTYAPTLSEIEIEIFKENSNEIVPMEKAEELGNKLRKEGKRIVLTSGCFDLLHKNHIEFLNEASTQGDVLIVGLNSDKSVRTLKGNGRPIIDEMSRAFVLSNLKCIDYVIIFEEETANNLIKAIKPDIFAKGGDIESREKVPELEAMKNVGGEIRILSKGVGPSTTKIIERINIR